REKFDAVSEEIGRLDNVVRNFLEFSRPPALKLQRYDVHLLIDKTLELFRHQLQESGTRLERAERRELPPVLADAEQIKQVLLNLLTSAGEPAPPRKPIRPAARRDSATPGREMVVIEVRDDGPGIPAEQLVRVFEPFFSTKPEGTGLGLCIS